MIGSVGAALLGPLVAVLLLAWEWLATRSRTTDRPQAGSSLGLLLGSFVGFAYEALSPKPTVTLLLGMIGAGLILRYALTTRGGNAGWPWLATLCILSACAPSMILAEDLAVAQSWNSMGTRDLMERLPQAMLVFAAFPLVTGMTLWLWDRHPDRRGIDRKVLILGLVATLAMMICALRPYVWPSSSWPPR